MGTTLTSILGRDPEIALICDVLTRPGIRLVSITGPGGVGKTRLALAVLDQMRAERPGECLFVGLSSVRTASEVLPALATALDIRGNDAGILARQITARLREVPILLVLDNMEHVRDAVPDILELLTQCPDLTILTTTRIALRIPGEQQIPLAPLAVPDSADTPNTAELAAVPSVALFLERASSAASSFALDDETRDDIAAICRDLEGIPLAIELAAPWLRVMSPHALRDRLGNRLSLLAEGPQHLPARHRTLRATLDWSYQFLGERERRVLRRCAIFAGSWPLAAAEAACSEERKPSNDVLAAIGTLIDHSLLLPVPEPTNAPRFRMLETIREFAREMLDASGDLQIAQSAIVRWCVAYAETSEQHVFGPEQIPWLDALGHERDTMRSGALAALDEGDAISALHISKSLGRFWLVRGHHLADHAWLERALAMDEADETNHDAAARAWGLMALGNSLFERGELPRASEVFRQASSFAGETGVQVVHSGGMLNDAIVLLKAGEVASARASAECSLAIDRANGRPAGIGKGLVILADIRATEADPRAASTLLEEALAINESLGDIRMVALTINTMGTVALTSGNLAEARALLNRSLALSRQTQERRGIATTLFRLGELDLREQHLRDARTAFLEAMLLRKEIGDRWAVFECAEGFADALATDQPIRAARMLALAGRLRALAGAEPRLAADSNIGAEHVSTEELPPDQALVDALVIEARAAMEGREPETTARSSPAPMPMQSGRVSGERIRPVPRLSKRELEILALLVAGYQDREIANALYLSVRTVSWHLTNVFTKLDVNSRVAAAVLAIQEGLVDAQAAE